MSRLLTPPMSLRGHAPSPAPPVAQPAPEAARPALAVRIGRLVILTALAAAVIVLISVSLIPALFVGLLFFLPALLPFVLLGLSVCAGEGVAEEELVEVFPARDPGNCTCAEDDLLRQDPSRLGACQCGDDDPMR